MPFHLLYTDRAVAQLGRVPPELLDETEAQLRRLANSPAALRVPIASPPFPPRGQLYHFVAGAGGESWFFTVIFRYSQDEAALHILSVTWRELDE